MDQYDIKQIEDISEQYGKLMDWFQQEYPEGTIRLEVNNDKRIGQLKYELTVMSGKEMSDDQRLMKNTITLDEQRFTNMVFMDKLKKNLFPQIQSSIIKEFNKQFHKDKEKSK